jgi:hypothetical protein
MADAADEVDRLVRLLSMEPTLEAGEHLGHPCLTVMGRAFLLRDGDRIAFRLAEPALGAALAMRDARRLEAAGGWVALPVADTTAFAALARAALELVRSAAIKGAAER